MSEPTPPVDSAPPDRCPFCRSREISTTSKTPDVSSYWRCEKCGQIWNAERLQLASRYSSRHGGWQQQ